MKLDFRCSVLPNGIQVATARMPQVESVAMGVWVRVGGRYEPPAVSGVSHFIEHLLFKGTTHRTARDISTAIEGRGGYFNAFTQEESTCYYARVAAEHQAGVLAILVDMYLHPRFAAVDIDKERNVIIEEIMMYRDQPQQVAQEMLGKLLWVGHPLGRPLIGTPEIIASIRRREICGFKAGHYLPANTLVAFSGKVDHDTAVAEVARHLGRLPRGRAPRYRPVSGRTAQGAVSTLSKDIEQAHLALGFRVFGRHDGRRYALRLLSVMLGENMSSRLFQVVRERHGLAYSIHSSTQLFDETGVLDIQAGVDRERRLKALEVILAEILRMREHPVGPRELRRAKDYAVGQLRISVESTTNQMMWAADNLMHYGRFLQPGEIIARVEAVTAAEIQRLARDLLGARNVSLALVAPGVDAAQQKALRAQLARLR